MAHSRSLRRPLVRLVGFTLVELTIVMGIISVMAVITLVGLNASREERMVQAASLQVAASLREAQNYALTGQTPAITTKNCWFGVEFPSATSYRTVRQAKDGSGNCTGTPVVLGTFPLTNNVTVAPTGTTVGFDLPRGTARFNSTLGITLTRGSISYRICVYPSGRIEERGTDLTCP